MRSTAPSARKVQHGLSMIELMIGMAIGLFITAVTTTVLTSQVHENRRLVLEARLMQDLRTAADIVTHDLRRAGYWGAAVDGVWSAGALGVASNPYAAFSPTDTSSDTVDFRYSRDVVEDGVADHDEQFGFRLRAGAIEIQLGAGNWQALTDVQTLNVTSFSVTPIVRDLDLQSFCATSCPPHADASAACGPHQKLRSLAIAMTANLVVDARIVRSLRSATKLRNDLIVGACPL